MIFLNAFSKSVSIHIEQLLLQDWFS